MAKVTIRNGKPNLAGDRKATASTFPLILSPSRYGTRKAPAGNNNRDVKVDSRLPACHERTYTETSSSTYGSYESSETEYSDGGIAGTLTGTGKTKRYDKSKMNEKTQISKTRKNQLPTIKSEQRISRGPKANRISQVPSIKPKTAATVTENKGDVEHTGRRRRRCIHCGSREHRSRNHDLLDENDSGSAPDAVETLVTATIHKYRRDNRVNDPKKTNSSDYGNKQKQMNRDKATSVNNNQRTEGNRSIQLPREMTSQKTNDNKPKNADVTRESRYRRSVFGLLNTSPKFRMKTSEDTQKHSFDTSLSRDQTSPAKGKKSSFLLSSQILQNRTTNNDEQKIVTTSRVLAQRNPKSNNVKTTQKFASIRSHTTIGNRSPANEKTSSSAKRSRSASKPLTSISCNKHTPVIHAYNSIVRLEPRPKTKSDSVTRDRLSSSSKTNASCPSLRTSDSATRSSVTKEFWSMKDLSRYRQTMVVYLDSKWQRSRRERFYRKLEEAQLHYWKEKRAAIARQKRRICDSKERQIKQLRYVRHKHQARRTKRLSTQHVKWKFVLNDSGNESKKFGLPSEYYTYYGFNPTKYQNESESESSSEKKLKNKCTVPKKEAIDDLSELRRRNQKRYDNIFCMGTNRPLKTINEIVKKGLFTIEVPTVESPSEIESLKPNQPHSGNTSTNKPKLLTKRSTRMLIVKDIVEEAKEILNSIDESYSDDFETDSLTR